MRKLVVIIGTLCIFVVTGARGHSTESLLSIVTPDWQTEQISSIKSYFAKDAKINDIDGKKCLTGSLLNIDIRDSYAFDIDEVVEFRLSSISTAVTLMSSCNTIKTAIRPTPKPGLTA